MRRQATAVFFLVLCLVLTRDTIARADTTPISGPVYEIFVPSFRDSNGDGLGDLNGIKDSLPYLASLNVEALWLTPIHPSPSYHHYDVLDYMDIDPAFGSLADFEALKAACGREGIRLLLDLVINHTSSEHPWFVSACGTLAASAGGQEKGGDHPAGVSLNPYIGYYNFTLGSGQYPVPNAEGWFYQSSFGPHMPDLNLDSELVREEIAGIVAYWLSLGADGFRLDGVVHYYEENTAKNTAFLRWFNQEVKALRPDATLVGEAWKDSATILSLYESGVDSFFNFPFSGSEGWLMKAIRAQDGQSLAQKTSKWQNQVRAKYPGAADAPFLSNHDTGRSAGFLRMDPQAQKQAAAIYLLLPGIPFVYYGEEIGMTGSGRDENKRLPMLWSSTQAAGMCLPPAGADQTQRLKTGVSEQEGDPDSLLSFYRGILTLRDRIPELARGEVTPIDPGHKSLMAYRVRENGQSALIIHNLKEETLTVSVTWPETWLGAWDTGLGMPVITNGALTLPPKSGAAFY